MIKSKSKRKPKHANCRVFWIFLPNVIKIGTYNFELYRFKVCTFLETQCILCDQSLAVQEVYEASVNEIQNQNSELTNSKANRYCKTHIYHVHQINSCISLPIKGLVNISRTLRKCEVKMQWNFCIREIKMRQKYGVLQQLFISSMQLWFKLSLTALHVINLCMYVHMYVCSSWLVYVCRQIL